MAAPDDRAEPGVATDPGPGVSYRLLGPLAAVRIAADGVEHPIEIGAPKQRAVLALLLVHRGRVVPTDRLVDLLWGDSAPPSATASLQAYVSNLRRALRESPAAGPPLVRRAGGYVLDVPASRLDVTAFLEGADAAREAVDGERWDDALRAADGALSWWRGELLEDARDEPWRNAEAARLEELRTACREARLTALLALRRLGPALADAQDLRAAQPLRDRACWLHMIALHLSGRSPDALAVYREHVLRLDEELGLEPGPELRELEVRILRHDPTLAAWPRPADWTGAEPVADPGPLGTATRGADGDAGGGSTAPEAAPGAGGGSAALVGRTAEQETLRSVVAAARSGAARWLVLTGPAGIGKTRLAEELAAVAGSGPGRVVWARCSDEDGAPAWWPIRQLVRGVGEDPDLLLVPPAGVDADEARFAVYERTAELLHRTAAKEGLLTVVVDDVQWADPTSARCLAHLVAALRDLPVVVVLTLRSDEDAGTVAPLLAALARSDRYREVPVGPLGPGDVAALAGRIAGAPLSARRASELAAHTGGNPLFVSEYARLRGSDHERGGVPLAVRSILGRRLDGLDAEVLGVLRAAAVSGDPIDLPVLLGVCGMDEDAVADLLDEAADEHVLVPTPDTGGYAFAHGLLRQEVLAGTPEMRRRRLHARAARTLRDARDGEDISRRAHHLLAAMPLVEPAEVLQACRAAARFAEERWSSESAADWWAAALRAHDAGAAEDRDPATRDDLLLSRVHALARAGRGQSVLDVLDDALSQAALDGRTATVGRLAATLLRSAGAWPWTAYGEDPRAIVLRLDGLRTVVAHDPAAHARVLAALAVGRCYDEDPAVPDALTLEAIRVAEAHGDPDVLADALLGRLITYSGVASHADEELVLAARLSDLPRGDERLARVDHATCRSVASMAHTTRGDVAAAERAVRDAIAASELLGLSVIRVQLRWMEGTLAAWRGDDEEARRQYAAAGRIHAQTELYTSGVMVFAAHGLARETGGLAGLDASESPEPIAWGAAVAAARGDAATAAALVEERLDALTTWVWMTLGHVVLVAHACADADLADLAPRVLGLLQPHAGRIANVGQTTVIGPVDLATGRLRALLGDAAGARADLERALELAERTGGVPSARRCRAALAALPADVRS